MKEIDVFNEEAILLVKERLKVIGQELELTRCLLEKIKRYETKKHLTVISAEDPD